MSDESSLLTTHHSSFIIHHSSFITHHSSLITHHSSLITHHSSPITHHSSLITYNPRPMKQLVTVAQYGIGPIGAEIAPLLLSKPWVKLVAAVDIDPKKIGRDVGEVIGLDRETGVKVAADLNTKADVVC